MSVRCCPIHRWAAAHVFRRSHWTAVGVSCLYMLLHPRHQLDKQQLMNWSSTTSSKRFSHCVLLKRLHSGISCGLAPSSTVMCRKTLSSKLDETAAAMLFDIRSQMAEQPAICTTADIWSCMKKSYMGVTAHWITGDLKRQSAALACTRMKGSHTYDVVAEHIMSIHSDFGLDHKKSSVYCDW